MTAINSAFINAILADSAYVDGLSRNRTIRQMSQTAK